MILFVLILFIVLICALSNKNSKHITFAIFVIAWVLFAFNYENPDYDNYVTRFENISTTWLGVVDQGISDVGFGLIMRWIYVLGAQDYYQFKFIVSAISLLCYFYFSSKSLRYSAFWAFLYLAFYLTLDIIQFRNFVAFSVILALFPLLEKDTFKSNILYLIGVLIASTIHFSMAFFLIMGLRLIKKKRTKIVLIVISLIVIFILRTTLFNSLQETSYYNKVDNYTRTSILGALVTTSLFAANYLLVHHFYLQSLKVNKVNGSQGQRILSDMSLANNIALYLLILIPFIFINTMPSRILRFASIIEIGYLLNYASIVSEGRRKKLMIICFLIAFFFFIWTTASVIDELKHNYILDYFI